MATLKITTGIRNETTKLDVRSDPVEVTTTGNRFQYNRLIVGTSEETLAVSGDLSNGTGYAYFKNQDSTNYVQIGIGTGAYFARLKAGETAALPLENGVTTLYLKANTASCELEVYITER